MFEISKERIHEHVSVEKNIQILLHEQAVYERIAKMEIRFT